MPLRKQEDKRKRILDAAARVFAGKGFYNANLKDIKPRQEQ